MTDIVKIGDATLYHGDCMEILPALPKTDVVVTDPPYDKFTHIGGRFGSGDEFGNVDFGHLEDLSYIHGFMDVCESWVVIFCTMETLGKIQNLFINNYVRGMVWDRINPSPQLSGDRPAQAVEGIALLHTVKKNMKWNGGGKAGIYRCSVEFNKKQHPTQKPEKLMNALINDFTNVNQSILDPFMGSGTTGVACANLGRKFVGIEIERKYFDIACERIDAVYSQGRLFDDITQDIEQGNLPIG